METSGTAGTILRWNKRSRSRCPAAHPGGYAHLQFGGTSAWRLTRERRLWSGVQTTLKLLAS